MPILLDGETQDYKDVDFFLISKFNQLQLKPR